MKVREARESGERIADLVKAGQWPAANALLAPVLAKRTPFAMLDRIGSRIGAAPLVEVNAFLRQIAAGKTEGGWPVIGAALGKQMDRDLTGAFARCREFIRAADVWYGADILGERVPGPALVVEFEPALALLAPWREDPNRWVRRTVGVAVHFWAKRSRGASEHVARARALLAFLEPMFEEREMDAVKGIGWGLKTLGQYYPDLVAGWLPGQIDRPHRTLMLRKVLTYLPETQRTRATATRNE